MGSRDTTGLFERGTTYYGPTATIDTADYGRSVGLEGHEKEFPDIDYSGSPPYVPRSQRSLLCRVLRNVSGTTLYAKRGVVYQTAQNGKRVDGCSTTLAARVDAVVDDALPSSGVRNGDLFWGMIKGPCIVGVALEAADADIGEQDVLVAQTAATSQAASAGYFTDAAGTWTLTEVTDGSAFNQTFNRVGRALSARTTAHTGGDLLADIDLL